MLVETVSDKTTTIFVVLNFGEIAISIGDDPLSLLTIFNHLTLFLLSLWPGDDEVAMCLTIFPLTFCDISIVTNTSASAVPLAILEVALVDTTILIDAEAFAVRGLSASEDLATILSAFKWNISPDDLMIFKVLLSVDKFTIYFYLLGNELIVLSANILLSVVNVVQSLLKSLSVDVRFHSIIPCLKITTKVFDLFESYPRACLC